MAMRFHTEDIEVNINIDGDEGAEPTPEVIEQQEVEVDESEQELEEKEEIVEAIFAALNNIESVIEDYSLAIEHVKKFKKVSKEMIHLMNRDGALGDALGMALPRLESDDLPEDIEVDNIDLKMFVEEAEAKKEGFLSKMKSGIAAAWAAVVDFFKTVVDWQHRARKRIETLKKLPLIKEEEFEKKTRRLAKKGDIKARMTDLWFATPALGKISEKIAKLLDGAHSSTGDFTKSDKDAINAMLKWRGRSLDVNGNPNEEKWSIKNIKMSDFFPGKAVSYKELGIDVGYSKILAMQMLDGLKSIESKGKIPFLLNKKLKTSYKNDETTDIKKLKSRISELVLIQKMATAEMKFMYGVVIRIMTDATGKPAKEEGAE